MWITEFPAHRPPRDSVSIYSETGERTRKHHSKSRHGCIYCKRRRIKCDEKRPSCGNCIRRRRICQYQSNPIFLSEHKSSKKHLPAPDNESWLLGTLNEDQLLRALSSDDYFDPELAGFAPAIRIHALESLKHFVCYDELWLKTRWIQTIMQNDATDLVINHAHLLHAVIALSTAHLAVMRSNSRSYWISSMIHWQHSLRAYRKCFQNGLEAQNIDAIYFSSQLQSMLAFLYAQKPFQHSTQRPAWLTSMRGTHILLHIPELVARLGQGIWHPVVTTHDRWEVKAQQGLKQNVEYVPSRQISALRQYCLETDGDNVVSNHERLEFLMMLERCPPKPEAINAFCSYINHAPVEYISRVKLADRTALLLMIYWCKLFARTGQWWLKASAESEARRLVAIVTGNMDDCTRNVLEIVLRDGEDSKRF